MSDRENMDVIPWSYPRRKLRSTGREQLNRMDLESNRQDQELAHKIGEFRSYLNTNLRQNSGLTVETIGAKDSVKSHLRCLSNLKNSNLT